MKIKQVPVQFKAGPDDGLAEGEFIVYPSTFIRKPDSYGDIVAPGAFLDDIAARKESGLVLPGLYGHRLDDPDFFVASALEESEDEHGWRIHGAFDLESPKGAQVYRLVKSKRLNQLSFAYDVLDEGRVDLGDGEIANELRKVKAFEFSFVPIGANQDTGVAAVKDATRALAEFAAQAGQAKAGRVLSAKNETSLRDARDAIDSVLASLDGGDDTAKSGPVAGTDQEKASGHTEAKSDADDEGQQVKSSAEDEEPRVNPSVNTWATHLSLLALSNE